MAPDTEWTDEALSGPEIDRRTVISLLGAAGLGGMAGCTGGGDGTETATDPSGGGTESATATPPSEDQFGGRLQAAGSRARSNRWTRRTSASGSTSSSHPTCSTG